MLAMQFSKGDSMLLSLLITTSALAQDCDGAALSKDILEMGPHEAAPAYGGCSLRCGGRRWHRRWCRA